MKTIFVDVDEHDALPDGCCQRFSALDAPRPLDHVALDGVPCRVTGLDADDVEIPARAVLVDDSSGGQSVLVFGGAHGLRLHRPDGGVDAEPYLLLAPDTLPPRP